MKRSLPLAVGALVALWFIWTWFFCRFYVPANYMAVITAKEGKALPPGQILAERGQKGVWRETLGEGRHFLNPYSHAWKIVPATVIRPGQVGLVTSKVGADLPQGEFLADPGEKGVWRSVLGPGKYRLNPVGYEIQIVDAVSIPIGYCAVITSLSGKRAAEGAFAAPGEMGVMQHPAQPGLYYINPKAHRVDVIEVGLNQVSLLGKEGGAVITKNAMVTQNQAIDELQYRALENQKSKRAEYVEEAKDRGSSLLGMVADGARAAAAPQAGREVPSQIREFTGGWAKGERPDERRRGETDADRKQQAATTPGDASFVLREFVGFPSRDGFEISLDMTVEFEFDPANLAAIYRDFGDMPAVVEKILMPQILSLSRLKGSAYRATDFIVGEGREKFQQDLTASLKSSLGARHIIIHNALIRHVNVPANILAPIQQASVAAEQDLTNREKQLTAAKQAELNTETQLIEQRGAEVAQETAKLKAEIKAAQEKEVAETGADTVRQVADIDKQTADVRAEKDVTLGRAKADATLMTEGERAKGFAMKIKALGDPQAYNMAELARTLNPRLKIRILHAGEGTFWTDLDKVGIGAAAAAKDLQADPAKK